MQKIALCVGINNYPGSGSDLQGCQNDVYDWAAELAARGFLVKTLLDFQATRANIIANIKYLFSKTVSGDSLIIQFSGHGTRVPDESGDEADGFDEALCPYDLPNLVYDDEIWALCKLKKPGVQLVFISDSCHSGSVVRAISPAAAGRPRFLGFGSILSAFPLFQFREVRPLSEPFSDDGKSPWPMLLKGGCQDVEYSYDAVFNGRPNGAFTRTALDALKLLGPNATYADWHKAIRKKLPSRNYPQAPTLIGSYQSAKIFS